MERARLGNYTSISASQEANRARMGMVEQFGNECWSERSQIYFVNDKRLS